MKAIVHERYGGSEVLELREVEKPAVSDDGVLVRVRAASINPVEWHMMTGTPYLVRLVAGLRRPRDPSLGGDFAGTVEAVGKDVIHVAPGDDVFGVRSGALAEYVCVTNAVTKMPANLTYEQAGAVGVAAVTALQGLRDKGALEAGHRVLINGASGGVGTFAVQIAKALGADVTGVCSTANVELVRSLGADRVIDYTREDFTLGGERYDLLLDNVGNHSWREYKRVLAENGVLVTVGAPKDGRLLGGMGNRVRVRLASTGSGRRVAMFIAKMNRDDVEALRDLIEAGKVTPVVDRTYRLGDAAQAFDYLGTRHARAKIVITIQD